jgi:hypothetical protein
MLLRDAQEEARIVYIARQNRTKGRNDVFLSHITEVTDILESLRNTKQSDWHETDIPSARIVGLLLMVALELANKLKIDSLEALESLFLEESP